MFETSLIDLEAKQHPRRKWAPLPVALALHGAVLASVALGQVWNVAAVGDPEVVTPFHVSFAPSLPPVSSSGHRAQTGGARTPDVSKEPVQPEVIPDRPYPATDPETSDEPLVPVDAPSDGPCCGPDVVPFLDHREVAPVAPAKDEILLVGGEVKRPVLLSGRPPVYSQAGIRARIEGDVILQAVISDKGRVLDLRVLRGLPFGLDQAAVEAVKEWIFEPAQLNGRPVKVYYNLTVSFRLK